MIQLARVQKFSPIIATASLHNETLLKSLGATHVVDRSLAPDTILSEIQKITGGTPVEYVYDAISTADTQSIAYQALAPGGALLLLWPDAIPEDLKADADGKRIVHVFGSVDPPFNRKISVEVYSRLTEWLKDGVIVVCLACSDFLDSGEAHRMLRSQTRSRSSRTASRASPTVLTD